MFLVNALLFLFRVIFFIPKKLVLIFWRLLVRIFDWLNFFFKLFTGRSENVSGGTNFLFVITVALIGFTLWASNSEFDRVITSQAKLISSEKLQTIQHFEGGIVKKIHVAVGQRVKNGDPLVALDPLETDASYQAKKSEFIQALVRVRRLDAEYKNLKPNFGVELKEVAPSQITNELLLLEARTERLSATLNSFDAQVKQKQSELSGAKRTLALVEEERKVILTLVDKGLEPKLEAVRAEKSYAESVSKVNTIVAAIEEIQDKRLIAVQENKAEVLQELAEANLELSKLEQALSVAADKTDRSIIRAPVDGIVNRVLISTIGGVLKAGEPLVEIVPLNSELIFESKVTPMDIGYVLPGQIGVIKLNTYDFSIYGSLSGKVEVVGSDSVEEKDGQAYFIVRIKPDSNETTTGRLLEFLPGMTAQIDIITGQRSVLSYISAPITRTLTTAFTEK